MLKRQQILLEDWQEEYIDFISKKYDMSFSESIRALICLAIIQCVNEFYPSYKLNLTVKDFAKKVKKMKKGFVSEELHSLLSKAYFEARKASEFRMTKEKSK